MVRTPFEPSLKRRAWSPEEDQKLITYIERYRIWNWNHMAKFAGLSRSGKSCRLRWMNYLRPDIKRGQFTEEEVDIILTMQKEHGNRWSLIASKLHGRTDNEIKNYWNSRFRNRMRQESSSSKLLRTKTLDNLPKVGTDHQTNMLKSCESSSSATTSLVDQGEFVNASYSTRAIRTEDNVMKDIIPESFIELGSLWEEPLQMAAHGLWKVENLFEYDAFGYNVHV